MPADVAVIEHPLCRPANASPTKRVGRARSQLKRGVGADQMMRRMPVKENT